MRTSDALERLTGPAVVCCATVFVFWLGHPEWIFQPGSPGTTDLGGHVVALRHLIEVSLPSGHILDWSHQWFGGYPSYYFYFPAPALLIAASSLLMPLEAATKLVAIVAPALLPACTWYLVRGLGVSRLHGALAIAGAVASLSLTTQYVHGGNVLSSVMGEYSYAVSLCFVILYLGRLARTTETKPGYVTLSALICLAALSHLIPTLLLVLATSILLFRRNLRFPILASWTGGFCLSAFWSVPFLLRSRWMAPIEWSYETAIGEVFPLPIIIPAVLIIAGLKVRSSLDRYGLLLLLAASSLAVYVVPHGVFAQGRSLPVWYLSLYILAGLLIADGLSRDARSLRDPRTIAWTAAALLLVGISLAQSEIVRNRSGELLQSSRPDDAEYAQLIGTLRHLPAGRVHWEHRLIGDQLLGSDIGLARVPLYASQLTTTLGLLVESAIAGPLYRHVARMDYDDPGTITLLQLLGVDYLVTFSPHLQGNGGQPALTRLAMGTAWTLWRVAALPRIEPLSTMPSWIRRGDWNEQVEDWLGEAGMHRPWKVMGEGPASSPSAARMFEGGHAVSGIVFEPRRIRFSTAAPGIPHLVRVSYFPNWHAYGAAGPYPVIPGFMLVVPSGSEVELLFERTGVEIAGLAISGLAMLGMVVLLALNHGRAASRRPTRPV